MQSNNEILFGEYKLGALTMKNRVVMAPMTRCRAIGNVPNELMAKYYADRANAGLIITEGVSPSPNGLGYARIPGIFSEAQVAGWKAVTDAVHTNNGKIVVQLMHTGRVSHQLNLPEGAAVVGPSAIAATGDMWTDAQGMQPMPTPAEIPTEGIAAVIEEYVQAAKNAVAAGFDGVEIHAANGYLPMQFLNIASNQRTDAYGGSFENRNRFVLELAAAMVAAVGKDFVGIRISPYNPFNSMTPDEANEDAQYTALAKGLNEIGVSYIHILGFTLPDALLQSIQKEYKGTIMLNGGYTADRAASDIQAGKAQLISFGNTYISNPDLVARMLQGAALTPADPNTFYTPGAEGYNDYATL
jgi:N-ethylmaleimide reductase